jgi:hypothetical protein
MTEIEEYKFLKEDIETVLNYIGTNIILNYARRDDTYSLNNRERIAFIRLSKSIGKGYDDYDLNKEISYD